MWIKFSEPEDGGSTFLRNVGKLSILHDVINQKATIWTKPVVEDWKQVEYACKNFPQGLLNSPVIYKYSGVLMQKETL
jgi:hypothetical protein